MKTYQQVSFILFTVIFLQLGSFAFATDDKWSRNSLRGIKGVIALVEDLAPDIEGNGLTRAQIQSDVEAKLQKAKIKILSREEGGNVKGRPRLYVYINTLEQRETGMYPYNIEIELIQDVYLSRDSMISSYCATWSVDMLGIGYIDNIKDDINKLVDRFVNAYLSVNTR